MLTRLTAEYTYSRRNMQTLDATSSDAIIFKTKDFFWIFFLPFGNLHAMENILKKRRLSSSLSISEIIDSKRGGYLSAWKALLQNGFR